MVALCDGACPLLTSLSLNARPPRPFLPDFPVLAPACLRCVECACCVLTYTARAARFLTPQSLCGSAIVATVHAPDRRGRALHGRHGVCRRPVNKRLLPCPTLRSFLALAQSMCPQRCHITQTFVLTSPCARDSNTQSTFVRSPCLLPGLQELSLQGCARLGWTNDLCACVCAGSHPLRPSLPSLARARTPMPNTKKECTNALARVVVSKSTAHVCTFEATGDEATGDEARDGAPSLPTLFARPQPPLPRVWMAG